MTRRILQILAAATLPAFAACSSGSGDSRDTIGAAVLTDSAKPGAAPGSSLGTGERESGEATFYADLLQRRRTASGEPLDQNALVAAHRRYPFGTMLRVTNRANGRSVDVRVIDRGPFGAPKLATRKIIDLSRRAAEELGFIARGRAVVDVEVLRMGAGIR